MLANSCAPIGNQMLNDTPIPESGLVERDEGVAERDEEQQPGEPEHVVAERVLREHHLDALPDERIVAKATNIGYPNRRNSGSQVVNSALIALVESCR